MRVGGSDRLIDQRAGLLDPVVAGHPAFEAFEILIDQGDFHGKILLIEKNNQWHKQRDDWGDPC